MDWLDQPNISVVSSENGIIRFQLSVPMDYSKESGERVTVACSWRASDVGPADARSTVVLIDGGPGGDGGHGVDLPQVVHSSTGLGSHHNLIGLDLRGRGASQMLVTKSPQGLRIPVSRPEAADFEAIAHGMESREALCASLGGEYRQHVTTRNNARDIEWLRRALGCEQFDIMAWAYGTYLAGVFGSMFPGRLRRFVACSPVNPNVSWQSRFKEQLSQLKKNRDEWAEGTSETRDRNVQKLWETGNRLLSLDPAGVLTTKYDTAVGALLANEPAWTQLDSFETQVAEAVRQKDNTKLRELLGGQENWGAGSLKAGPSSGTLEAISSETYWSPDLAGYFADMHKVIAESPYGFGVMRVQPWVGTFRNRLPDEPIQPVSLTDETQTLIVHPCRNPYSTWEAAAEFAAVSGGSMLRLLGFGSNQVETLLKCPDVRHEVGSFLSGIAPRNLTELELGRRNLGYADAR